MIEPTEEMVQEIYERIDFINHSDDGLREGLAAVLAIVARDHCLERRGHVYHPLARPTCSATIDTKGTIVRCTKKPDGHDTHLARHEGWDVIW